MGLLATDIQNAGNSPSVSTPQDVNSPAFASGPPVSTPSDTPAQTSAQPPLTSDTNEPVTTEPVVAVSFHIAAVGDFLPHTNVHYSARVDSGYDFNPLLKNIDPLVDAAAVAICHLEVPFIEDGQQVTGYPMFGASRQIAFDLKKRGWDGCTTASNHSVDKKFTGIQTTLATLEEAELGFAGTARTEEESKQAQFYTVSIDGVDTVIASISVTRNLNGLPVPDGKPWSVNLIDANQIVSQAKAARTAGADIVTVSVHDGVEYTPVPTQAQQDIALALAQSGEVDLYIGHHPHVPQPITKLPGGPHDSGMWTAYSLGNFISNQDSSCCAAQTSNGLMMFAHVENDGFSAPKVTGVSWRALTVDRRNSHKVLDLSKLNTERAGSGNLSADEISRRYEQVLEVVGTEAPELLELPQFTGQLQLSRVDLAPE